MDQVAGEVWLHRDQLAAVEDIVIPGPGGPLPARAYRPSREPGLPALVFFHGGGWVVGNIETHDGLCRRLARLGGAVVVSIDYRLAPEHRFPAAVDDARASVLWVRREASGLGIDPERISVGGESAGGTLSAVVARHARDAGLRLASQVLIYPPTDIAMDTESYRARATGFNLTAASMRWFFGHYVADLDEGLQPDCSPLRAGDLGGLAPAYVLTCEFDPLRDEGRAYAERLSAAGVETAWEDWTGTIHGFMLMDALTPVTDAACRRIAGFLRDHWG